ncbi:hypothetical protein DRQ25_02705 [Candidatus Fermentibacteria bacterium]|nr:MAG: hypothetical protein DRQ25_02705 [Candidatus Fermentibacteria bacterium]
MIRRAEEEIYITDRIAYLRLQKTGSSHVLRALKMVCPGRQGEMHGRLPESILHSDRVIAASVRNPWDWYVSVWAYGCDGKGVLFDRLTEPRKLLGHGYRSSILTGVSNLLYELCRSRRIWRETYSDSSSPALFRRWLQALLDPEKSRVLGEAYCNSSLSRFSGFYTYRYCHLFHSTVEHLYDGTIHNQETLREAEARFNIIQHMLRMEKLTDGILELLKKAGIAIDRETTKKIMEMNRTNPSSRLRDTSIYYDHQTTELVREREALIVEKYGYRSPEIEAQ